MKNLIVSASLLLMTALVLPGFNVARADSTDGGKLLGKAEVLELVTGNTVKWTKGAGYYKPDGTLIFKWKGSDGEGKWRVNDEGTECWIVDKWWGGTEKCFVVWYKKGDEFIVKNTRKNTVTHKPNTIFSKGNNLSNYN